jgi:hypothetical protein
MAQDYLQTWIKARDTLLAAQVAERDARTRLIADKFPGRNAPSATVELQDGHKLTAKFPLNYKLDQDKVNDVLDTCENLGDVAKHVVGRLVRFKGEIATGEYKLLSEATDEISRTIKSKIDAILTIKPGMPQLELTRNKKS